MRTLLGIVLAVVGVWVLSSLGGGQVQKSQSRGEDLDVANEQAPGESAPELFGAPLTVDRDAKPSHLPVGSPLDSSAGAGEQVRIRVRSNDALLKGVRVRLLGGSRADEVTDSMGVVTFRVPSAELVQFVVLAEGWRTREVERSPDGTLCAWMECGVPIRGRVVDDETGMPLGGASVTVKDWLDQVEQAESDEAGRFLVPGVSDDSDVIVTVRAPGFAAARIKIRVEGGRASPSTPTVRLRRSGWAVGHVYSALGQPCVGAAVVAVVRDSPLSGATDQAGPGPRPLARGNCEEFEVAIAGRVSVLACPASTIRTVTDREGKFRISGLVPGMHYLVSGYSTGQAHSFPAEVVVTQGETASGVRLDLRWPSTLHVSVGGVPEASLGPDDLRASVSSGNTIIRPVDGQEREPGTLQLGFADLPPGHAVLKLMPLGWPEEVVQLEIPEGGTLERHLELRRGLALEGVAVDEAGQPLSAVAVTLDQLEVPGGSSVRRRVTKTDAHGRFRFDGLLRGRVRLHGAWMEAAPSRSLATERAVLASVPSPELRLTLVRLGAIRVRLLTKAGDPYSGNVWIDFQGPTSHADRVEATSDGILTCAGLQSGVYHVVIAPHGSSWVRRSVRVAHSTTSDMGDVTVSQGISIAGYVADEQMTRLAGASITCLEYPVRQTETDARGLFQFDRFPDEPVSFLVEATGYTATRILVRPDDVSSAVAVLLKGQSVVGTLRVQGGGVPVAGTAIELRPVGAKLVQWQTDGGEASFYAGSTWLVADGVGGIRGFVPEGRWVAYWLDGVGQSRFVGEWVLGPSDGEPLNLVLPDK